MHRFLAAVLGIIIARQAPAGEAMFVIVQPGYPGSTSEAESFVYDLSDSIVKGGGPAGLKGSYHNDAKAALKAIEVEKPAFGIVSLGFYLAHKKELHLGAILESRPRQPFYLAAKKGEPAGPKDLAGQVVTGTPFQEKDFVERILFGPGADGGPVKPGAPEGPVAKESGRTPSAKPAAEVSSWKVEATQGWAKGIRDVARGKARAVLLTERERLAMEGLTAGKDLEISYKTEGLPVALVVSIGEENDAVKKSAGALEALGGSAEGKEILRTMGIEGFAPVDKKRLQNLEERYGMVAGDASSSGGKAEGR